MGAGTTWTGQTVQSSESEFHRPTQNRQAAFPDVHGHGVHDNAVNYFVLFDQVEGFPT